MRISDPKDPESLIDSLAARSDDELMDMINIYSAHYRADALALARAEMVRRGYHVSRKGKVIKPEGSQEKRDEAAPPVATKPSPPSCPRCHTALEYVGTRRLHEDKEMSVLGELGEMFKDGAHEFLDVYICRKCGHVELFVDGIGEEFRPF